MNPLLEPFFKPPYMEPKQQQPLNHCFSTLHTHMFAQNIQEVPTSQRRATNIRPTFKKKHANQWSGKRPTPF